MLLGGRFSLRSGVSWRRHLSNLRLDDLFRLWRGRPRVYRPERQILRKIMIEIDCWLLPEPRYVSRALGASMVRGASLVAMAAASPPASPAIATELAFGLTFYGILKRSRLKHWLRLGLDFDGQKLRLFLLVILFFASRFKGGSRASILERRFEGVLSAAALASAPAAGGAFVFAFAGHFLFVGRCEGGCFSGHRGAAGRGALDEALREALLLNRNRSHKGRLCFEQPWAHCLVSWVR